MRTAIFLVAISLALLAAGALADEPAATTQPDSSLPALARLNELAAGPGATTQPGDPLLALAAPKPSPGEPAAETVPGGVAAEKKVPHGPADPVYREPVIPDGSANLDVTTAGPFRLRKWNTEVAAFPDGRFVDMPRWFADPYDDVIDIGSRPFGWRCEDALAFIYCPARFLANLAGLPVSMIVHPLCSPEVTNLDATVVDGERGAEVRPLP